MDMSPAVINATLDQVKDAYINCLRLNGGEPFLAPDAISNIVDGVIRRRIAIEHCAVFTNGTVRDPKIADALKRLGEYLEWRKAEASNPDMQKGIVHVYGQTRPGERVTVIVSQAHHENSEEIPATLAYYGDVSPVIGIGLQDDLYIGGSEHEGLIVDGLAAENAKELIGDSLSIGKVVRRISNQFSFVRWTPDYESPHTIKRFDKTIGIAANGNVYAGCLLPYDRLDASPICNVLRDDLLHSVENYCWQHPATRKKNNMREYAAALELLQTKGIGVPDYHGLIDGDLQLITIFEQYARELHTEYPALAPWHVQLGAAIRLCDAMYIVRGDDSSIGMRHFVETFLNPDFKPDIREMLCTDSGRHTLAQLLEEHVASNMTAQNNTPTELDRLIDSLKWLMAGLPRKH